MGYREKYDEWLTSTYFDAETKAELKEIESNEKEIEDRFYKDLEFGTAGLRGVIGAGTNRMNIYTAVSYTHLAVLLIFLISIIGFTGIGIGLSGLTLLFAKTASFESIVSYGLLLISGTVISYQNMPDIIFKIIRILPFVLEIDISQKVLKKMCIRDSL